MKRVIVISTSLRHGSNSDPVDEKKGLKWIHKATFQGFQPAIDYCKEHGYKWY